LEDIIKKRLGRKMIGFAAEEHPEEESSSQAAEVLRQVTAQDLVHVGMIPELVGRLPVITALEHLNEHALVKILTEPRNALIKQYQKFFEMEDTSLEFTPGALLAIAKKALKRDTGARALRAVTEEIMLDIMFELPDQAGKAKYVIDEDIVEGKAALFSARKSTKKETA